MHHHTLLHIPANQLDGLKLAFRRVAVTDGLGTEPVDQHPDGSLVPEGEEWVEVGFNCANPIVQTQLHEHVARFGGYAV